MTLRVVAGESVQGVAEAAIRKLQDIGYSYHEGAGWKPLLWAPPVGVDMQVKEMAIVLARSITNMRDVESVYASNKALLRTPGDFGSGLTLIPDDVRPVWTFFVDAAMAALEAARAAEGIIET